MNDECLVLPSIGTLKIAPPCDELDGSISGTIGVVGVRKMSTIKHIVQIAARVAYASFRGDYE